MRPPTPEVDPVTPSENRTLARSSVVLLIASGLRLVWGLGSGEPMIGAAAVDDLPRVAAETDSAIAREQRRSRPLEPGERIDLNQADSLELQRLPRVGPSMAAAILESRTDLGRIRTWADLDAVAGVGPATLERLKPWIEPLADAREGPVSGGAPDRSRSAAAARSSSATEAIRGRKSVSINRADSAALIALPGIGPALAGRILAFRARHGPFKSLEDLVAVRGIGPATVERLRPHVIGGS